MSMIIDGIKRLIGGNMKRNDNEPLYGDDRCQACGGEIVKVREGRNPVFACWKCGKRA